MDEFYTVNQSAIILKVHPLTIRRYIKDGRLKAYRAGGNIRIRVLDLKDFAQTIDSHKTHTRSNQLFQKSYSILTTKPFSFSDSLFRIKAKGRSMTKLEE